LTFRIAGLRVQISKGGMGGMGFKADGGEHGFDKVGNNVFEGLCIVHVLRLVPVALTQPRSVIYEFVSTPGLL